MSKSKSSTAPATLTIEDVVMILSTVVTCALIPVIIAIAFRFGGASIVFLIGVIVLALTLGRVIVTVASGYEATATAPAPNRLQDTVEEVEKSHYLGGHTNLITPIHEVGHNLGFRHIDGFAKGARHGLW